MSTVNLKQQLGGLVKLQELDTQIYALSREKQAKPEEIKALEAAFEAKKASLSVLEKKALDLQKQKKDKELELASKEENIKKLQGQLYALKTNKEYSTMMQQIADAKADSSVTEDKILELMDLSEKAKGEAESEKQRLKGEEGVFNSEKNKVSERVKEIDGLLAQLDAKRRQVIPEIEANILAQYDRILANRDGLAIAKVKNNSCMGCNMHVTHQVVNLIRMYERVITCEVCNRMLYIEDEAA